MTPLQTGPSLTLDASSSGDSYFVKIKLKSISNTLAAPGGWERRGRPHGLRADGVDSGHRTGRVSSAGVTFTARRGPWRVWFGRRPGAGLPSRVLDQH